MTDPTERLWTTPFTCTIDKAQHEVTDEAFKAHRELGVPLVAVCGHEVDMTPAIAPTGTPCDECLRIVRAARRATRRGCHNVEELHALLGVPLQRDHTSHRRHQPSFLSRVFHHDGQHSEEVTP